MAKTPILAIEAALKGNWAEAVKLNQDILEKNSSDTEALNRLAHAFKELGQLKKACQIYQRVLGLDPYNPIAKKNLKQLVFLTKITPSKNKTLPQKQPKIDQGNFLEEPGKTKIVPAINPASAAILLRLSPGDPVTLVVKKHTVTLVKDGQYLGALPDDLAYRLRKLCRLGNKYEAYVRSVAKNNLQIFLKEQLRNKRLGGQPSFPQGITSYQSSLAKGVLDIDKEPLEISEVDEEESPLPPPPGEESGET